MAQRKILVVVGSAVLAVAVAGSVAAAAAGRTPHGGVPSSAQARAAVSSAFELASRDANDVCDVAASRSNCEIQLQSVPPVSSTAPTVVCDAAYPGDDHHSPGRLVHVEGSDGNGGPYSSDLLAIRVDGKVKLVNPVYWSSTGINDSGRTDTPLASCTA